MVPIQPTGKKKLNSFIHSKFSPMRQTLLLALALFVMFSVVKAADSSMSITTSKAVGQTIKIALKAENVNTIVHIDYGDGVLVEKTIGTSGTDVSGILKGSTVKVYGEGIIWFYCDTNKLTDVDVTNYPSLLGLNCNNNNLTSLDLSQNTLLRLLYCANNALTELDISNNKALESLRCHDNQLTSFDVSNNGRLFYTKCFNNELTFASLPSVSSTGYKAYEYAGQADVEIIETITDGIVDLSNQYSVSGNLTNYTWKTEGGTMLTEGVDYDIEDGVTSFLNVPSEKVYCEMTNASFPDFIGENVLKTTLSTVEGVGEITDPGTSPDPNAPAITMTTGLEVGQTINFQLMAQTNNTSVLIDYGDGTLTEETIATSRTSLSGILAGSEVKIYGEGIITLTCDNQKLLTLDVSNAINLVNLECRRNQLTSLDLSNNVLLEYLHCYYNSLTSLDVSHNTKLETLICSSNQIEELDVTSNLDLKLLSCGTNKIDSLDVSGNLKLTSLNCRKNTMKELLVSNSQVFDRLECGYNQLTFSHLLPTSSIDGYYQYTPQATLLIQSSVDVGSIIDLSDQYLVGDNETSYTWITEDNKELVEGDDFEIEGGVTTFLKSQTRKVRCVLSNASLPAFRPITEYSGFTFETTLTAVGANFIPAEPPAIIITKHYTDVRDHISGWPLEDYVSRIDLIMRAKEDNTTIYVDYGDGIPIERTIGTLASGVVFEHMGDEMKIYGSGIVSIYIPPLTFLRKVDVSNCPELEYLKCVNNYLDTLNVSGLTKLRYLACPNNRIDQLDVSSCIALDTLGVDQNNLSSLDLSNNTMLSDLSCDENNLTSLDLSNNTQIRILSCDENDLTSLNLSGNPLIKSIECSSNQIDKIEISADSQLERLSCYDNKLTFASLPLPTILYYYYYWFYPYYYHVSQADIDINANIDFDGEVDLSDQYERDGNITNYTWKTEGGSILNEGIDYEIDAGITTFLNSQGEKVYCEMTNATFPMLTLRTTLTSVGVDAISPAIIMTTSKAVGENIEIALNTEVPGTTIQVDYGDGVLVEKTTSSDYVYIGVSGTLKGSEVKIYGDRITRLICNSNQLTELDISNCPLLKILYCDYNQLTSLDISNCIQLERLFCSSNHLTFASLPLGLTLSLYSYSYQKNIEINSTITIGNEIDLSDQYERYGNITNYIWKNEGGTILSAGIDYEMYGGITTFLYVPTEKVYCEMTNSTFPDLTLKTTLTEIIESPGDIDIEPAVVNVYGGVNSITLQTETNAQVEVYDIYGKPIVIKNVDSGQNTINGISQGMYVVKVKGTKTISTQKVTVRD